LSTQRFIGVFIVQFGGKVTLIDAYHPVAYVLLALLYIFFILLLAQREEQG